VMEGVTVLIPKILGVPKEDRWRVWKLYKCPSCSQEVYTEHETELDRSLLQHMQNFQTATRQSFTDAPYSYAFIPANTGARDLDEVLACRSGDATLKQLDEQFDKFIEEQRLRMEERIRKYATEQQQQFSELHNRALAERNVLFYKTAHVEDAGKQDHSRENAEPEERHVTKASIPDQCHAIETARTSVSQVSSVRLMKDEIAVSASGEREIARSVESEPLKKREAGEPCVKPAGGSDIAPSAFVKAKKQRSLEPALFDFDEGSLDSEDWDDTESVEEVEEKEEDDERGHGERREVPVSIPYGTSLPLAIPQFLQQPAKAKLSSPTKQKQKFIEPHVHLSLQANEFTALTDRPSASWRPSTWMGNI